MPWHWYWTSAVPRALTLALPLGVVGLWLEPQTRGLVATLLASISMMSFVGHKEVCVYCNPLPVQHCCSAAAQPCLAVL